MRLRTRVIFLATLSVVAVVLIGVVSALGIREMQKNVETVSILQPAMEDIFLLNMLTQNYLNRPRDRVARQWLEAHDRMQNRHIPVLQQKFNDMGITTDRIGASLADVLKIFEEMKSEQVRADTKAARVYRERLADSIQVHLTKIVENTLTLSRNVIDLTDKAVSQRTQQLLIFMAVVIALMVVMTWFMVRGITVRLKKLVEVLSTDSLRISSISEEHKRVLEQQVTAVNQTTTTMAELDTSARGTAEQANVALNQSQKVLDDSRTARDQAEEMQQAMSYLKGKIHAVSEQIQRLTEQTGQIQSVTESVADIASQTNMLALNAAVEASRAGEHGKGFAVVSQEIRKLAYQSKGEAERIRNLVFDIQGVASSTVMAADEGSQALENTTHQVVGSGESFLKVAEAVEGIVEGMQMISLNAKEQSKATSQVLEVMTDISNGGEQARTGVTQNMAAINNIADVADKLKWMV